MTNITESLFNLKVAEYKYQHSKTSEEEQKFIKALDEVLDHITLQLDNQYYPLSWYQINE